jgi:putative ABC transport system permease protein
MFLGVTLFAASYDSFQNLQASYESTFTEFRFANLTVSGGDVTGVAAIATGMEGVESVQIRTEADVPVEADGEKLLGRVVGLPAAGQPSVNQLKIQEGAYLDAAQPELVLVEQHMADHFSLTPGGSLAILVDGSWVEVEVAGVVSSPEYIWPARDRQDILPSPDNFGVVFASENLAAAAADTAPNQVVVYYDGGEPNPELTDELSTAARQAGATAVFTRDEQPSNAALTEDLKGFEEMGIFFPVLFLLAAAMAAYVMINRLVYAQRPQIGVLLANGFTRFQVLRHYLGYGIIPGLAGAIPGAVAGVLLARLITGVYTGFLAVPVTLIRFYPATLVAAVLFGLVAAGLAALAPALVASRVQPAEAMRGETPTGKGRPSIAERLVPPLRKAPVGWKMPLRGVERNPRRTVYTIVGVVLSLMLVLVSWGMIDTIEHLLDLQFVEIQREDATVFFAAPVDAAEVKTFEQIDGVNRAESALTVPVSISAGERHYDTALVAFESGTQLHGFKLVSGEWVDLPTEGLLVGAALEDLLGVTTGDTVTVMLGAGAEVTEEIAGFVDEPLGTMAYLSRDRAETLAGVSLPATSALLSYEEGADPKTLRTELTALPEVAAFEDANAIYVVVKDSMILFYAFVGVMLVFGAAMAFALIFNAMSVNIAERSREVATMLAVGVERRSISRYITTENLLVAALGIPIGLVAGYFTSKAAMSSFSSDMFAFDLYIKPTTYLWAAVAILVVALLAQLPGLRAVRRLNIPKITKERSA